MRDAGLFYGPVETVLKIKSVCLGADCFAFGELLGKAPQVTKGACSWLGSSFVGIPSLRSRSVGPRRTDIHVKRRSRRIHAARPTPRDLRSACTQVAFCGDWTFCVGRSEVRQIRSEADQKRGRSEARQISSRSTASRLKPVPRDIRGAFVGLVLVGEEASPTDCMRCF